jgi:hypothetical protein
MRAEVTETSAAFISCSHRMALPRLDPNWTRRPPPPPPKDDSFVGQVLITLVVVCLAIWFTRSRHEVDAAQVAASARSKELAMQAHIRQQNAPAPGSDEVRYISEAEAARQIAAAGGQYQDNQIHRCVSRSADTHQLGPCRAPFVEAPYSSGYTRQDEIAEQARVRREADARLRAEEQRFAALTGQSAGSWPRGYSANPNDAARERCAWVKAQRDEAYRLAGNNRTFDFIRSWDDAVFEACKEG